MENLFAQLCESIEVIREAKGAKLRSSLDLIHSSLSTFPMLPHNMLKVVLVRVSAIAKTSEVNQICLEILQLLINSDFILDLFDCSKDNSMILTVLLSALVKNIEKDQAGLKKIAWICLKTLILKKRLPKDLIKAAFPGLLKPSIEEIKKFRVQGLGCSEGGFQSALVCVDQLLEVLEKNEQDDWKRLAVQMSRDAFLNCVKEIVKIVDLGLLDSFFRMEKENKFMFKGHTDEKRVFDVISKIFCGFFKVFEKNDEVSLCLLKLSACFHAQIDVDFDEEIVKKTVLVNISEIIENDSLDLEKTKKNLKVASKGLEMLEDGLAGFLNLYQEKVVIALKKLLIIASPVNFERFLLEEWIKSSQGDCECLSLIQNFIKISLKYQVFDYFFENQHILLKNLKKGLTKTEIDELLMICLIFSSNYPENSLHILSELVFLQDLSRFQSIFSKFFNIFASFSAFLSQNLTFLEMMENLLLSFYPETSSYYLEVLTALSKQSCSISSFFIENSSMLTDSLVMKLSIFGPVTQNGIIQYLKLASNLEITKKIAEESMKVFDLKHKSYSSDQILSFLHYFHSIVLNLKEILASQKKKLENGNLIRLILMRSKKFLSLRPSSLEHRKIIQTCLTLFKDSLELIDKIPFEIDPTDRSTFAFEEDSNVSIPNGLAELSYEFLPSFVLCFKLMADSNCSGISLALVEVFRKIHEFDEDFFTTEKRFCLKFFPLFKILMKSQNKRLEKLWIELIKFMIDLGKNALYEIRKEVLGLCDIIRQFEGQEIKFYAENLKKILTPEEESRSFSEKN